MANPQSPPRRSPHGSRRSQTVSRNPARRRQRSRKRHQNEDSPRRPPRRRKSRPRGAEESLRVPDEREIDEKMEPEMNISSAKIEIAKIRRANKPANIVMGLCLGIAAIYID